MNLKGKKETIYAFVWGLFSKVLSYLLLLILANLYLKPEFGRASFVISIYSLTFAIAFLGATNLFTSWYIKKKDCTSIFYFMSLLTAIVMIIWIAVSINHLWIIPFALILPLNLLNTVSASILNSKYRYDITQSNTNLFLAAIIILAIIMVPFGKVGIILAYSFGYVISSLRLIYLTRKDLWGIIRRFNLNINSVREYLLPAITVTLISFGFAFLGWFDSTILGLLSTFENVAIYGIVGPISNILTLIPLTLGPFLLTRVSELKNKEISKNVLKRVVRISYTLSILAAIVMISLLGVIFQIFFPKYVGNEVYVMILSIGILLYGVYYLVYTYTIGELNPGKGFAPIGIAALLNIILDIILIPKFGIYGIAFATTFAHLTAFILLLKKTKMLSENLKFLIPLIFLPIAFYMSYWGLIFIPICFLFLIKTKIFQKEDFAVIKRTIIVIFDYKKTH